MDQHQSRRTGPAVPARPVSRGSDEEGDLPDGAYGVRLETAPAHPGLIALALPWESGAQHKAMMARACYLANIVVLVRDRHGGHISLDRRGRPILHYRLSNSDRAHLLRGIQEASRVHAAAGAEPRKLAQPPNLGAFTSGPRVQ